MSLYASSVQIGGVPCGPVLRGSTNGEYRVVFEREHASLEEIEAIQWDPPVIVGACILPSGYGFTVTDIQYAAATRSYTVVLQVGKQYLGDVTGYQEQVTQLQETVTQQAGTIQSKEAQLQAQAAVLEDQESTIAQQAATIQSQAAAIEELEEAGTAAELEEELKEAYTEGVESNG